MKKESFYIQHDYNAFLDPKIRYIVYEHSVIAYAVFWIALEILASQKDYRAKKRGFIEGILPLVQGKNISLEHGAGIVTGADEKGAAIDLNLVGCYSICLARLEQMLSDMIEQGLFATDGEYIWSDSLNERMKYRKQISEKRSEAGRKGGHSKAGYKANEANAKQKIANAKQDSIVQDRIENLKKPTKKALENEKEPIRNERGETQTLLDFFNMALQQNWCDQNYCDAKMKQYNILRVADRNEIKEKMDRALNCSFSKNEKIRKLARTMYHETVGLIQDRSLDKTTVDAKTLVKRREFNENPSEAF